MLLSNPTTAHRKLPTPALYSLLCLSPRVNFQTGQDCFHVFGRRDFQPPTLCTSGTRCNAAALAARRPSGGGEVETCIVIRSVQLAFSWLSKLDRNVLAAPCFGKNVSLCQMEEIQRNLLNDIELERNNAQHSTGTKQSSQSCYCNTVL